MFVIAAHYIQLWCAMNTQEIFIHIKIAFYLSLGEPARGNSVNASSYKRFASASPKNDAYHAS